MSDPGLTYNPKRDEFLVAFLADVGGGILSETEVHCQRVTSGGVLRGAPLRISDIGRPGDSTADGFDAVAVAYDSLQDRFLVVWRGDDVGSGFVNGEFEVFGQLLRYEDDALEELGGDFQISMVGGENGTSVKLDALRSATRVLRRRARGNGRE